MTGTISTFVSVQDAKTPTMSNRTTPSKPLPPLTLEASPTSSDRKVSERSLSSRTTASLRRQPKFSNSSTKPIVLHRSPRSSQSRILDLNGLLQQQQVISPKFSMPPTFQSQEKQQLRRQRPQQSISTTSTVEGITASTMNSWITRLVVIVTCDLLRSGMPLQLLLQVLQRIKIQLSKPFRPVQRSLKVNTTGLGIRFQSSMQGVTTTSTTRKGLQIKGIPNYGETCFLNSVLQALASLSPFLVYLERIVQVEAELQTIYNSIGEETTRKGLFRRPNQSKQLFSRQLFDILNEINGSNSRSIVDPRGLLQRIGKENPQFQSRHTMEQQDAQELLQTLVDIVITDARLDCTSSYDDQHLKFFLDRTQDKQSRTNEEEGENEILTSVLAIGIDEQRTVNWSTQSCKVEEKDSLLSLSDLVHRIEQQQIDIEAKNEHTPHNQILQREEKKQEDFELKVNLEDSKESRVSKKKGVSSAPKEQLQKSMQIMRDTMSSITPSPLSGWIGSALRCCNCNHVRAIQNAPFLNIPVVPTSVPKYLNTIRRPGVRSSSPNLSPLPLCTLDQCLAAFTSVERVGDVECQSCTIKKHLERLEDEAMLLQGAIETMEKKILQKGGDPSDQVKCLREDLSTIERHMIKLQTLDPDDDQSLSLIEQSTEPNLLETEPFREREALERCDALKCLTITRCPSVLCCHIQRRYFDPFTNQMEKCIQYVDFPDILDVGPYCAYSPMTGISWAAGSSRVADQETQQQLTNKRTQKFLYKLQGIIEHRGNAHGGHYICYRRDHSGEWFRISDANITPIPWRQVKTCQAYMLFYEAI